MVEHYMACRFIGAVMGRDWSAGKLPLCDSPDPWMLNGNDAWLRATNNRPIDVRRVVYQSRVVRLADCFYTLIAGKFSGFDILRERFRTRETKPCFIEAEIASMLVVNGFEVEVKKESGKLGADFDLAASYRGEPINIEVTAKKDDTTLTAKTLTNTLNQKRKQLPDDAPAALYLHVPADWMHAPNTYDVLNAAIVPFVRGSARLNVIVFVWEFITPFLDGGFTNMIMRPCFSNGARHPFSALDCLAGPITQENGHVGTAYKFFDWYEANYSKRTAP
jgi:hypothetical protein